MTESNSAMSAVMLRSPGKKSSKQLRVTLIRQSLPPPPPPPLSPPPPPPLSPPTPLSPSVSHAHPSARTDTDTVEERSSDLNLGFTRSSDLNSDITNSSDLNSNSTKSSDLNSGFTRSSDLNSDLTKSSDVNSGLELGKSTDVNMNEETPCDEDDATVVLRAPKVRHSRIFRPSRQSSMFLEQRLKLPKPPPPPIHE